MPLPARDSELIQIMDASFADATRRAGPWLACKPGCTQCCHGAFAINALDTARLRTGMESLRTTNPALAAHLEQRALHWIANHAADFPGNLATGTLGTTETEQKAFEEFANEAPCPALNPQTGLCDIYEFRPMTCRVFGPPVRVETDEPDNNTLACCELCFIGATTETIATCEMHVPHDLESEIIEELNNDAETVVAFALLPTR
jgi:Fe-S-cluster containining protein